MSDFSDRPLVAGSLVGLRAFGVDTLGRLASIYHSVPFLPGENVAECRKTKYDQSMFGFNYTFTVSREMMGLPPLSLEEQAELAAKKAAKEKEPKTHDVGGVKCSCGYYAYFDGANDYKQSNNLAAIIEGYGVCSVGDRGFRASKARLVAIVAKGKGVAPERMARVMHNYPDVPVYATRREAVEAHRLTPPSAPTPETADDFWTRAAK